MYSIRKDNDYFCLDDDLAAANVTMDLWLGHTPENEVVTYSAFSPKGELVSVASNRRIVGTFVKQRWEGRKEDYAIQVAVEEFDATNAVLLLSYDDFLELSDSDESSDDIGRDHVSWAGPCEVRIVDSICAYFQVEELGDITSAALASARARVNPQPPGKVTVTVSVKLRLSVSPSAAVTEFLSDLDYSFVSNTPGVVVLDTEIVDSE